jgi:hypothetical protein
MIDEAYKINEDANVIKLNTHLFILTDDKDLCDMKLGDKFYQEIK